MVKLYTTYYNEKNEERRKEYEFCLNKNLENPLIDNIYILNEGNAVIDGVLDNSKIELIFINNRPKFSDFLRTVNETTFLENDISIIANSDIYFDDHLEYLSYFNLYNTVLALTRWDVLKDGSVKFYNKYYSQDVWIFKGKIKNKIHAEFYVGQFGCDNRLAYEIKKSGYNIMNPSLSLKTYHYHASALKTYNTEDPDFEVVPRPYLFLLPSMLDAPIRNWLNYFINKNRYKLSANILGLYREIRYEYYKDLFLNELNSKSRNYLHTLKYFFLSLYYFHYLRFVFSKLFNFT